MLSDENIIAYSIYRYPRMRIWSHITFWILIFVVFVFTEIFLPDRKLLVHITMSKLENILTLLKFLRVNRSCIVRKNAIFSIQDMRIETILPHEERIIIGTTYWEGLKPHFKQLF